MAIFAHSVCWSAFRAGSLASLMFRTSRRSRSGFVIACTFGNYKAAATFARRWAVRLGLSVIVRAAPHGGGYLVSVPVAWQSSRLPVCNHWPLPVQGLGVRGFSRLLVGGGIHKGAC